MGKSRTGDENYDAILDHMDEIRAEVREEMRLTNPTPVLPNWPSISMAMGDVRMTITLEHIGGPQKVA